MYRVVETPIPDLSVYRMSSTLWVFVGPESEGEDTSLSLLSYGGAPITHDWGPEPCVIVGSLHSTKDANRKGDSSDVVVIFPLIFSYTGPSNNFPNLLF